MFEEVTQENSWGPADGFVALSALSLWFGPKCKPQINPFTLGMCDPLPWAVRKQGVLSASKGTIPLKMPNRPPCSFLFVAMVTPFVNNEMCS